MLSYVDAGAEVAATAPFELADADGNRVRCRFEDLKSAAPEAAGMMAQWSVPDRVAASPAPKERARPRAGAVDERTSVEAGLASLLGKCVTKNE